MKKLLLFFSFLLPLLTLNGDEPISSLSVKAEALFMAHDHAAAKHIYEQLLSFSLPSWQKEHIFYNMGTLHLAQQLPKDALITFQKISPTTLSLPRFGSYLFLNTGIAYLQYALSIPDTAPDQGIFFIQQSLKAFDQAEQLECQEQKEESDSSCLPSLLLVQWKTQAYLQLKRLVEQRQQQWMAHATAESLASFLFMNMQAWINHLKLFEKTPPFSTLSYFQQQGESLLPLWSALEQKKWSADQKLSLDRGREEYLAALQKLEKRDLTFAMKQWEESLQAVKSLTFQNNQAIQYVELNYDILLLQEHLTSSSLKALLKQMETLKGEKEKASLAKAIHFLQSSIKALQAQDHLQARFFLLASSSQFHALVKKDDSIPVTLLQNTLNHAHRALQLSFLLPSLLAEEKKEGLAILQQQQKALLSQAALFIPAVIKEQEEQFHQTQDSSSHCSLLPWDSIIPLYDHGLRFAEQAAQEISQKGEFNFQLAIASQMQTMQDWNQALNLMLHPPSLQEASTAQQWKESLRQMQEMMLEDQAEPTQATQELHAW